MPGRVVRRTLFVEPFILVIAEVVVSRTIDDEAIKHADLESNGV
jgi:hypothetical protein